MVEFLVVISSNRLNKPLPPGVHLHATFVIEEETIVCFPVRLLGDETRGYLLAGLPHLPELDGAEVWFPTLAAALAAGERLGVARESWTDLDPGRAV